MRWNNVQNISTRRRYATQLNAQHYSCIWLCNRKKLKWKRVIWIVSLFGEIWNSKRVFFSFEPCVVIDTTFFFQMIFILWIFALHLTWSKGGAGLISNFFSQIYFNQNSGNTIFYYFESNWRVKICVYY